MGGWVVVDHVLDPVEIHACGSVFVMVFSANGGERVGVSDCVAPGLMGVGVQSMGDRKGACTKTHTQQTGRTTCHDIAANQRLQLARLELFDEPPSLLSAKR
jgi:hypothetical protein